MSEEKKTVETPAKFKTIVESIEKMSVIDLHELVKHLALLFEGLSLLCEMAELELLSGADVTLELIL